MVLSQSVQVTTFWLTVPDSQKSGNGKQFKSVTEWSNPGLQVHLSFNKSASVISQLLLDKDSTLLVQESLSR